MYDDYLPFIVLLLAGNSTLEDWHDGRNEKDSCPEEYYCVAVFDDAAKPGFYQVGCSGGYCIAWLPRASAVLLLRNCVQCARLEKLTNQVRIRIMGVTNVRTIIIVTETE